MCVSDGRIDKGIVLLQNPDQLANSFAQGFRWPHDFEVLLLHVALWLGLLPDLALLHGHRLLHRLPRLLRPPRFRHFRLHLSRCAILLQRRGIAHDVSPPTGI